MNNVYVWIREYPKLDLHRWSQQISLTIQLQSIQISSDALQTRGSVRASRRPITFRAIVTGSWPCRFSIDVVNQPSNDRVNPLECASLRTPFTRFNESGLCLLMRIWTRDEQIKVCSKSIFAIQWSWMGNGIINFGFSMILFYFIFFRRFFFLLWR